MQWIQELLHQSPLATSLGTTDTGNAEDTAAGPSRSSLQREGNLSREQLLNFFQAGEALLTAEATRQKLKDAKLLKQDVEELITSMQRQLFEQQGVGGDHGVAFLGQVSTVYKDDAAVMAALLKFAGLEEDALDEAEMPAAEYAQKQRLLELAKAHTAQLMAKLDTLPLQERQAFLQEQLAVADQLKQQAAGQEPQRSASSRLEDPPGSSMSQADQLKFFQSMSR